MRTLILTSPVMRGEDVRLAQRRLNNFDCYAGPEDGVFGEQTARACSQAKWILGYANKDVKPIYGDTLNDYLLGFKKPSIHMRRRASSRASSKSLGEKALRVARAYVGTKENPPGSNQVMFSEWYGIIGPWCMMFVTYCFVEAGSKAFKRGSRWAYCPFAVEDARLQRGTSIVPRGQERSGDVVFFSWKRDGFPVHVGILISVNKNGTILTIEGNTSVDSASDGGEVQIRTRDIADVVCFVRAVV
jgi:hypothetical protein